MLGSGRMFSNKIAGAIQELLTGKGFNLYYVDQAPSYDQVKNLAGYVVWDIEEVKPMQNTEGVDYTSGLNINLNFVLMITIYGSSLTIRNGIEATIMNVLQPKDGTTSRRKPLQSSQLTNGFVRSMVWVSDTEFPIPKTAQSNAEMSASVLMFNSSISVLE